MVQLRTPLRWERVRELAAERELSLSELGARARLTHFRPGARVDLDGLEALCTHLGVGYLELCDGELPPFFHYSAEPRLLLSKLRATGTEGEPMLDGDLGPHALPRLLELMGFGSGSAKAFAHSPPGTILEAALRLVAPVSEIIAFNRYRQIPLRGYWLKVPFPAARDRYLRIQLRAADDKPVDIVFSHSRSLRLMRWRGHARFQYGHVELRPDERKAELYHWVLTGPGERPQSAPLHESRTVAVHTWCPLQPAKRHSVGEVADAFVITARRRLVCLNAKRLDGAIAHVEDMVAPDAVEGVPQRLVFARAPQHAPERMRLYAEVGRNL